MKQTKPLSNKEYLFALVPYMKKRQWGVIKMSMQKRAAALKKEPEKEQNINTT